ncbi:uncharacterized protein LOC124358480 [Homalodisca vitripennis]|uniref:uncharacterized protein LOC124358480 n=1 Tax=Homalodisca vitripennis TaxID=197043 RepID=UPI001EEA3D7E|nr:uncharacterized protein LOC124358480 [Homalodisca vitripennis]
MVLNLTDQVAALVKQLAAGTGQHPLASTSNPSQAVHTPHIKSNTQIQGRSTATPTFRDKVQQNTKPALSLEERKKLWLGSGDRNPGRSSRIGAIQPPQTINQQVRQKMLAALLQVHPMRRESTSAYLVEIQHHRPTVSCA